MRRASLSGLVLLIGCGGAPEVATSPGPVASSKPVLAPAASAPSPPPAAPLAIYPFVDPTPSPPTFHVVLAGEVEDAAVDPITGATFVNWTADEETTLARVNDGDLDALSPVTERFVDVYGRFPDHAYLVTQTPTRAYEVDNLARWNGSKWKPITTETGFVDGGPSGAGWLTLVNLGEPFEMTPSARVLEGQDATPPAVPLDMNLVAVRTFPNGDAFDLRRAGETSTLDAHVDGKHASLVVPFGTATFVGPSSHDQYAFIRQAATLLHFDGDAWQHVHLPPALGVPRALAGGPHDEVLLAGTDALWLRGADGAFVSLGASPKPFTPEYEPTNELPALMSGLDRGAPWAVTREGLQRLIGREWTNVRLPHLHGGWDVLTPTALTVLSPNDVWLVATTTRPRGTSTQTLTVVLHTQAPKSELRAGGRSVLRDVPTYGGHTTEWTEWGARPWLPLATDECTKPLVVVASRLKKPLHGRPVQTFTRVRGTLKKLPDAAGLTFTERSLADDVLLLAPVPSLAAADSFVRAYTTATPAGAAPEVLCEP